MAGKPTLLRYQGETRSITDWAIEVGMRPQTISSRLRLGWPIDLALGLPPNRAMARHVRKSARPRAVRLIANVVF
jgi:hypothetical protein